MKICKHPFYQALCDKKNYVKAIEQIAYRKSPSYLFDVSGVSLSAEQVLQQARSLARTLQQSFLLGTYPIAPYRAVQIFRGKKHRTIYRASLLEDVLEKVMFDALMPQMQIYLSCNVYGFFSGQTHFKAIDRFADYVKQQQQQGHSDLYVLRSDIVNYTDSIDFSEDAPFWFYFTQFLAYIDPEPLSPGVWDIIKQLMCPYVVDDLGGISRPTIGTKMGRPLSTVVAALYAKPIDDHFSDIAGGFYTRYGDDILFAHRDEKVFLEEEESLTEITQNLRLQRHPEKDVYYYLSNSGFNYSENPKFKGTQSIEYLGLLIFSQGTKSTSTFQRRRIYQYLKKRLAQANRLVKYLPTEQRERVFCETINHALMDINIGSPLMELLISQTTNEHILKSMDYWLVRQVLFHLTGSRHISGFRKMPYKRIRRDFGLRSLCQIKFKRK